MTDTRNRILAIAATVSVASSLAATTAAHWDDAPAVTTLAETREPGSKLDSKIDSSRTGTKIAPTVNKATPSPKSLGTDKDKAVQQPR